MLLMLLLLLLKDISVLESGWRTFTRQVLALSNLPNNMTL